MKGAANVTRGRRRGGVVLAAVLVVCSVAAAGAAQLGGSEQPDAEAAAAPRTTARVTRQTLVDEAVLAGQLDHGPELPMQVRATGTVTWLPAPGTVARRGAALARIDERPVVLFYGDVPMYRELGVAETAEPAAGPAASAPTATPEPTTGRDVRQFEANLVALGYSGLTVDETFTDATAEAVQEWQRDLGVAATGRVGIGDVYYAAGPVRVSRTLARVGAAAGGDLLTLTGTTRAVTVAASVTSTAWAVRGAQVSIDLPDGRSVPGRVASVSGEVAAAPGGEPGGGPAESSTVSVVVNVPNQRALGSLTRAPVTVRYVVARRRDVLTVPVTALLALAEGGYGVEVVDGTATRYEAVATGLFADGHVEVSGSGVREGLEIVVAE